MTNEEAKTWLNKLYVRTDIIDDYGGMEDMQPYEEAVNMAIKALEQEDILGKIRAEIEGIIQEETVVDNSGGEYERTISKLDPDDVLQIIDKYRAESEDKE